VDRAQMVGKIPGRTVRRCPTGDDLIHSVSQNRSQ
jgi:hypothetical protein